MADTAKPSTTGLSEEATIPDWQFFGQLSSRLTAMTPDERFVWFADNWREVLSVLELAGEIRGFMETDTFETTFPMHHGHYVPSLTELLDTLNGS